jgi:hypothetical protein
VAGKNSREQEIKSSCRLYLFGIGPLKKNKNKLGIK